MKPPFLRTAYNYDTNKAGDESAIQCQDQSMTQQHFAEECDINTIVKRFNLTGQLPENIRMPVFEDYENIFDFHSAMNSIAKANEAFDAMPAEVRARFHNDPGEFVTFCLDEKNREEATRLGLVAPPAAAKVNPGGTPTPKPESAGAGTSTQETAKTETPPAGNNPANKTP